MEQCRLELDIWPKKSETPIGKHFNNHSRINTPKTKVRPNFPEFSKVFEKISEKVLKLELWNGSTCLNKL